LPTAHTRVLIVLEVEPGRHPGLLEMIQETLIRSGPMPMRRDSHELEQRCESLTRREREVFVWVASGLLNKQVAAKLGASEKTIKAHRAQVMKKMKAKSFADLVRMADRLGIG
jgi:FixJ family two-component response regulator